MTALQYEHGLRFRQFPNGAETLARRGARVDNIVAAAALGRENLLRTFVNSDGTLKRDVPLVAVHYPPAWNRKQRHHFPSLHI